MAEQALNRSTIRPVKERIEDELLARPGVSAVDINVKYKDGKPTGELAIVVFVDEKKAKSKVSKADLIPAEIDGIPTDVQEEKIVLQAGARQVAAPQVTAYQEVTTIEPLIDTTKYTPLRGGISMGPCRSIFLEPPDVPSAGNYVFTGTLGAIVKDRVTKKPMALTNFHVACVDSGWSVGDTMAQPSRVDGGSCPADRFGTLTRAALSENIDGAVVSLDIGANFKCSIEEIGDVKGKATAVDGMAVRKRGRTTELTYGTVNSTDVSVSIDYGDGLGNRTLKHQIRIAPDTTQNVRFSDQGDSGSVVVNNDKKVIGLLFAGTTSGSATFANPIQKVLDELNVDLCVTGFALITNQVICDPVVSKAILCEFTKPVSCHIVTKSRICNIITNPVQCDIRTNLSCPPISLACPFDRRPGRFDPGGFVRNGDAVDADELYGQASEAVDDAYWLGYYAALEAAAEAEDQAEG